MSKKKLKVSCRWPKHSKKTEKAIDTLLSEGYVFNSYVQISVDGSKKGFSLSKSEDS